MKPKSLHLSFPNTPQPLSILSEEAVSRFITVTPIKLFNRFLNSQAGGGDESLFFFEAASVQQYVQRHFRRGNQGHSLQLGRIQSLAFKEAIYTKVANERTCHHDGESYLYPLFLAKYLIFNEFMDGLALPMSELHNTSYGSWLQKICDEEYEIYNQPGPRQWLTTFFLSRQSLTRLELGFCDDTILTTIGENLWALVSLKLTLSHLCSDIGLIRLMHKKVPDEYRKLRQLSNAIISTGVRVGPEQSEALSRVRKPGKVTLEELQSFVDRDVDMFQHAVKMRGCPFLKSLTLFGDIGCYQLTEERTVMFRCGLHLILFDCKELCNFEVQIDSATKPNMSSSSIANVPFHILNDLICITGDVSDLVSPCLQTFNISLPALSMEDVLSLQTNIIPCCTALNFVDCSIPDVSHILVGPAFQHITSLMLLRVDMVFLQSLLPELKSLTSATLGVDFKSELKDLLSLRNNLLPCQLKRLHIVFEGPRDKEEKVTLEPNEWIRGLKISLRNLDALQPSTCKEPKLGPRSGDKNLFQELFDNEYLRGIVRRIFIDASPVFSEVNECLTFLEELELSGTFHWAQGIIFAMMTPHLKTFRINPMREIEIENFMFLRDLRMTILPYLLVMPLKKIRRITVGGHDDMFFDNTKIRELMMVLATSEEFGSLEYCNFGRSLYFNYMQDFKFRSVVRMIAIGQYKNIFRFDVCHSQFDPHILDVIKIKLDPSRFYTMPLDASYVY